MITMTGPEGFEDQAEQDTARGQDGERIPDAR